MTRLLASTHVAALAREESVRGEVVRQALAQAGLVEGEEALALLENALQLLLTRFQAMNEENS